MNSIIIAAIKGKLLLRFYYDGGYRTVEPHCYALTTKSNEGLRAYQVSGHSSSGNLGWKMFDLSKAINLESLDEKFTSHRPGYNRNDKGMSVIYCEL